LTKSTKYDIDPMDFWLRVIIAEKGKGKGEKEEGRRENK